MARRLGGLAEATVIDATWRRQIGPCALEAWGARWVAVRYPRELAPKMCAAGGLWEPGSRRGLSVGLSDLCPGGDDGLLEVGHSVPARRPVFAWSGCRSVQRDMSRQS
jgi:hypothetical protein